MKIPPRTRSVGNHPAARYVWALAAVAVFFAFSAWIGPVNVNGGRSELGKLFVIFLFPILVAVFGYDPAVRLVDRLVYPKTGRAAQDGADQAVREEDHRRRAEERALKSRASRPFSSSRLTPWLYAAALIGLMALLLKLASLIDIRDGLSLGWVIIFGLAMAAIPAYDPVVRRFDDWFGKDDSLEPPL